MLVKILIGLAVVVALLLIVIVTRPARFRYVRTTRIAAPPATVFALVNDFRKWRSWSPWEKLELERTYAGPAEGVGTQYSWVGAKDVGEGRMTIVESDPHKRIEIKLEFKKPIACTNRGEFTFTPVGDETEVSWSMDGDYGFMAKAMGLVINFDKMVGAQFAEGLADMKRTAESETSVLATP